MKRQISPDADSPPPPSNRKGRVQLSAAVVESDSQRSAAITAEIVDGSKWYAAQKNLRFEMLLQGQAAGRGDAAGAGAPSPRPMPILHRNSPQVVTALGYPTTQPASSSSVPSMRELEAFYSRQMQVTPSDVASTDRRPARRNLPR
jgi:hypothetical protein